MMHSDLDQEWKEIVPNFRIREFSSPKETLNWLGQEAIFGPQQAQVLAARF